jgi:signal transduction histidine kinase
MVSGIAITEWSAGTRQTRWLGRPAASDLTPLLKAIEPMFPTMPPPHLELLAPPLPPPGPRTRPGPPTRGFVYQLGPRETMIDGEPAIVLPLSAFSTPAGVVRTSSVVIRFDAAYLAGTVLPQLADAHASADDTTTFRFELRRTTAPAASDEVLTVGAFRFRPDCLPRRVRVGAVRASGARGIAAEPLAPLVDAVGQCRMAPDPAVAGLLKLVVRRRHGRMTTLVTAFRWRQQAASGLVLAALVVTMGIVVVSAERARRQARRQTVIAAGISHELRTPLASLRLAADDLKSGQADSLDRARHYGDIIDLQSRRLGRVVDQALALTAAADASALRRRALSIVEIVEAAVEPLAPALRQAGVRVERRVMGELPLLFADPDIVRRCLTNLIENAIKYAAAGEQLVVSAQSARRAGRAMVEVTVEDRGPGIDEDERAAIFEPFHRGRSARQSRHCDARTGRPARMPLQTVLSRRGSPRRR